MGYLMWFRRKTQKYEKSLFFFLQTQFSQLVVISAQNICRVFCSADDCGVVSVIRFQKSFKLASKFYFKLNFHPLADVSAQNIILVFCSVKDKLSDATRIKSISASSKNFVEQKLFQTEAKNGFFHFFF